MIKINDILETTLETTLDPHRPYQPTFVEYDSRAVLLLFSKFTMQLATQEAATYLYTDE